MAEKRIVKTLPGEIIDFETTFVEEANLRREPSRKGHIERIDYTTDVYEDGVVYPKYCNVYLPYGYDPEDKSKKYNVLYYQHGNTCDPEIFAIEENRVMFDNLFECGEIEPCIVVSITYYFDVTKDVERRRKDGYVPAGDGNFRGVKGNYYQEIIKDIIPAVEMKYNTYLEDPSPEGIKKSRDHRAFTGYSRGSVCTWNIFHHDFEYFRWYAPMSCHTVAFHEVGEVIPEKDYVDFITAPIHEHPDLPFYIYASCGGPKDVPEMKDQMKVITKQKEFSYGTDPEKNNIYYSLSDYVHTDYLVPYYYYNSMKVLFKGI